MFQVVSESKLSGQGSNTTPFSQSFCNTLTSFFQDKVKHIFDNFANISGARIPIHASSNTLSSSFDCPSSSVSVLNNSSLDQFSQVSPQQISLLISSSKSGSPNDPCPPTILKLLPELISINLTNIFNQMFTTGIYPSVWKRATIKPLLKKSHLDPTDTKSYRPIACLPLPAKIAERVLNVQLSQFIENNNLLDDTQFGFRRGHGTETALIR